MGIVFGQEGPFLLDDSLKVEQYVTGLSLPTQIEFVDEGILVIQKNDGKVFLVKDGNLINWLLFSGNAGVTGVTGVNVNSSYYKHSKYTLILRPKYLSYGK